MADDARVWSEPSAVKNVSADSKIVFQKFTATVGQTLFDLTDFVYVVGTGALHVYVDGKFIVPDLDFFEISTTRVELVNPEMLGGEIVVIVGFTDIDGVVPTTSAEIFVATAAALRAYIGAETIVYIKGIATAGDGGEDFFQLVTGEAPGTFVDDNKDILLPNATPDGSAAWLRNKLATYLKVTDTAGYFTGTNVEAVLAELGLFKSNNLSFLDAFRCYERSPTDMYVNVAAGLLADGATQISKAAQLTALFVAPAVNPRIDVIVISNTTGVVSVVAGVEAGSPVAPAVAANQIVLAQVALTVAMTEITDADITDKRVRFRSPGLLDEDDMASNSAVNPVSQQSLVAYIAAQIAAISDAANFTYGDGSDGALLIASNQAYVPTLHQYTTYEIDNGFTVTVPAGYVMVIKATVSITINGTIDASGIGVGHAVGGSGGGSGGGDATVGIAGEGYLDNYGGVAGAVAGAGGAGNTISDNTMLSFLSLDGDIFKLGGSDGQNGGNSDDVAVGGVAGLGGGAVLLIAPSITIGATGVIDVSGSAGLVSTGGTGTGAGGGSGGGGGMVLAVSAAGGYTQGGTITLTGGAGGAGFGTGGAGGAGGDGKEYNLEQ